MKFALLIDAPDTLKPAKDSSISIMRELFRRGHTVTIFEQRQMCYRAGQVVAWVTEVALSDDDTVWYTARQADWQALTAFDVVLMRKDPPVETEYLYATQLLELAQRAGARILNAPDALRDLNEKLAILRFPQWIVPTLVSSDMIELRRFAQEMRDVIFKPLDGMGGMEIFRVREDGLNLNAILETLTRQETRTIMAQQYIPAISAGDKRVFLLDGEPLPWALARIPAQGETRGNLAAGGRGVAQPLSARDWEIARSVGAGLKGMNVFLVGLDIIGDWLTEINITSPTGLVELTRETGQNMAAPVVDALERRCS